MNIWDLEDGDLLYGVSNDLAVDSDGHMMMRMGDTLAVDMDTGDIHFVTGWNSDKNDNDD